MTSEQAAQLILTLQALDWTIKGLMWPMLGICFAILSAGFMGMR